MSDFYFAIIEVQDGMTIIQCGHSEDLEAVAIANAGTVIDPGPFTTYEEAFDELLNREAHPADELIE